MKRLALVLLLLAGCSDDPARMRTDAEISDIASDAAADATAEKFSELEARIDDLETAKDEAESKVVGLEAEITRLTGSDATDTKNIETLFANDRAFGQRLNIPVSD